MLSAGDVFAQLVVLQILPPQVGKKNSSLRVQCSCGNVKEICRTGWGIYKSCGCTRYSQQHNMSKSQEYRAWQSMLRRCSKVADAHYKNYGARGVKVCQRWQKDFLKFLSDLGPKPSRSHRLDRRKVNGNYTPKNCAWVTVEESNLNKRNAAKVLWHGEEHYLKDVAALYGIELRAARREVAIHGSLYGLTKERK